jgi:flagellar motor switch protein FliM
VKPERAFIAERTAAQHCPELLRRGPLPAELLKLFERAGERLARSLSAALAPLLGADTPRIDPTPARELRADELAEGCAGLGAHSLFAAGADEAPLLTILDGQAVLCMVDRAFGGRGEVPAHLPERFPPSAELMIERIEGLAGQAIAAAFGGETALALRALRREGRLSDLDAFAPDERLAVMRLDVREGARAPWPVTLALPLAALPALVGHQGHAAPARPAPRAADPAARPFADLPLPLSAVLVDMRVPLAAISALEPGCILPVAVARAVPLRIGASTIARGTVGAQDDRIAIKLTQIA